MFRATLFVFALALFCATLGCQTPDRTVTSETTVDEEAESEPSDEQNEPVSVEPRVDLSGFDVDINRPGSTYREIDLDEADPHACRDICESQMRCLSFVYVRKDHEGGPKCELKHSVPVAVTDQNCCISGVHPRAKERIEQMESQGFELGTRRPGSDFRDFEMDQAEPERCQKACENLMDCKAFTYVRPDYEGEKAHCYLKDDVPEPVADKECCISGVTAR